MGNDVKYERVCHNCKREPEAFLTDKNEVAHWIAVPKGGDGDPTVIMSNFTARLCVIEEKNCPDIKGYDLICVRCCEAILAEDEDDD
jgi:hypothetical protein